MLRYGGILFRTIGTIGAPLLSFCAVAGAAALAAGRLEHVRDAAVDIAFHFHDPPTHAFHPTPPLQAFLPEKKEKTNKQANRNVTGHPVQPVSTRLVGEFSSNNPIATEFTN